MRKAILLAAAILAMAGGAEAQTVKCGHPRSLAQQIVCDDAGLRGMDRRINGLYLHAITFGEPPDYFRLKRSQKPYLATRDACRSASCLERVFRKRHYELSGVLYE